MNCAFRLCGNAVCSCSATAVLFVCGCVGVLHANRASHSGSSNYPSFFRSDHGTFQNRTTFDRYNRTKNDPADRYRGRSVQRQTNGYDEQRRFHKESSYDERGYRPSKSGSNNRKNGRGSSGSGGRDYDVPYGMCDVPVYVRASSPIDPAKFVSASAPSTGTVVGTVGTWYVYKTYSDPPLPQRETNFMATYQIIGENRLVPGTRTEAITVFAQLSVLLGDSKTCTNTLRLHHLGVDGAHVGFSATITGASADPGISLSFQALYQSIIATDYSTYAIISRCDASDLNSDRKRCDNPSFRVLTRLPTAVLTDTVKTEINQAVDDAMAPFCLSSAHFTENAQEATTPSCSFTPPYPACLVALQQAYMDSPS